MAIVNGFDGVVKLAPGPTGTATVALGSVQRWSLDETAEEIRGYGMGDASASVSAGALVQLDLYPGGEGLTGGTYYSGEGVVTGISRTGEKAGMVGASINVSGRRDLDKTTIA